MVLVVGGLVVAIAWVAAGWRAGLIMTACVVLAWVVLAWARRAAMGVDERACDDERPFGPTDELGR